MFSRSDYGTVNAYIAENSKRLNNLKFNQNFVETTPEFAGVKLALREIYDQEFILFTRSDWKPFLNHQNAAQYLEEYDDMPEFGGSVRTQCRGGITSFLIY